MRVAEGSQQFGGRGALEQIAAGPGGQRIEDVLCVFIDREHDDLELRGGLFEAADAFDTVHAGQVDVHEDHLRLAGRDVRQGVLGVGVLAEATEALGPVDQTAQRVAHLVVVFDNAHGDRHGGKIARPA